MIILSWKRLLGNIHTSGRHWSCLYSSPATICSSPISSRTCLPSRASISPSPSSPPSSSISSWTTLQGILISVLWVFMHFSDKTSRIHMTKINLCKFNWQAPPKPFAYEYGTVDDYGRHSAKTETQDEYGVVHGNCFY